MDKKTVSLIKFFGFACLIGLSISMLISLYFASKPPHYAVIVYVNKYGEVWADYAVTLLGLFLGIAGFYFEAKEIRKQH
ncbi:hypothetical protein HY991_03305 [Candidatus Micrarchaeota archaeon]|nr:hypothetical protein [Candidatus Micrarchaeota archaeon]